MQTYNIEVNTNKQILSSETKVYKTERFFYQTKKLAGTDRFVLKISESLFSVAKQIYENYKNDESVNAFKVETYDKSFNFLLKFGFQLSDKENIKNEDIVFFGEENEFGKIRMNDQRIVKYLADHKIFNINIKPIFISSDESDFKKIYILTNSEYINFPLLSEKQQKLVEIENENVLVQGVAGSGKTNVCLNKIIWVACRNYTGRILYTTFSRGLIVDTKNKIELFKNNIKNLIDDYQKNRIVFLDKNHKKAIENRLGIYLVADTETNILKKLQSIADFLETHIDYYLIEDLYKTQTNEEFEMSSEKVFVQDFLKNINNHQLKSKLLKIKNLSYSIIYKEIYGMIFGTAKKENNYEMLSLADYKKKRENSFSSSECEVIYSIAELYDKFLKTQKLYDNNKISEKLLKNTEKIKKYSLAIVDEVQDFTEINLELIKSISIKMFAVGDALQMINPAYFSFANLKRLMYDKDVTNVAELECNYRNNKKIVEILDNLSEINIKAFGTHSFVLSGESIDQSASTTAIYTDDSKFFNDLKSQKFENFTILVGDYKQKEELRKLFKKQEILTISEIKGLERETVLLYNILSDNKDKWQALSEFNINHKQADENSVYRYYFNLFYVGLSRAKHNIFVYETDKIAIFDEFFKDNFEIMNGQNAYERFSDIIGTIDIDDDEIYERINEFIKLGQFENAKFYANKFADEKVVNQQIQKIDIYEKYIFKGKNKQAGILLWKAGLADEAKEQFAISGDTKLSEFIDNLQGKSAGSLDGSIVRFFVDFDENDDAQQLILEVLRQELASVREMHKQTKNKLKEFKEKYKNGK